MVKNEHLVETRVKVVRIPYQDDLAMTIIMPEGGALAKFQRELTGATLRQLFASTRVTRHEVTLTMPKFKIESNLNLKELFEALGHRELFDAARDHDFSEMTDAPFSISDAIQK